MYRSQQACLDYHTAFEGLAAYRALRCPPSQFVETFLVRLTAAATNANLFVIYLGELWPAAETPLVSRLVLAVLLIPLALVNLLLSLEPGSGLHYVLGPTQDRTEVKQSSTGLRGSGYTYDPGATSMSGATMQLSLGKQGGGKTRFQTGYQRTTPGFEINDLGFLSRALAEPGTRVRTADGIGIEVAPLPFVPTGASR